MIRTHSRERLSIVHVVRSPIGGIFRHISDLCREQHARGHQVALICDSYTCGPFEQASLARLEPFTALGQYRVPMPRHVSPRDFFALYRVGRILDLLRPDILHAHGAKAGLYGRLDALRPGRKNRVFYSPHGGSLHYSRNSLEGRGYFYVERLLQRHTDGVLHVCQYEDAVYEAKVGSSLCPRRVVYNGVDRTELRIIDPHHDATDFLYVGMLRDLKGVDVLIRALSQPELAASKSSLTVVGNGNADDERRYRHMVDQYGLADRVSFRGSMPARSAFRLGRILVVPSRAESFPYIVLEAISAGLPVIATGVGGIPEILDEHHLPLSPPGDPKALAKRMADVQSMSPERALPDEAFAQRFCLNRMAQEVLSFYEEA